MDPETVDVMIAAFRDLLTSGRDIQIDTRRGVHAFNVGDGYKHFKPNVGMTITITVDGGAKDTEDLTFPFLKAI